MSPPLVLLCLTGGRVVKGLIQGHFLAIQDGVGSMLQEIYLKVCIIGDILINRGMIFEKNVLSRLKQAPPILIIILQIYLTSSWRLECME